MRKATLFTVNKSLIRTTMMLILTITSLSIRAQCPPLTVFCQDLHTSYMADLCMVDVWAKDFVSKINTPETSLDSFIISFEEDSLVMSQIFYGENGNSYTVRIWITSKCDPTLKTSCVVQLDINDNTGECSRICDIDVNPWCGYSVITCSAGAMEDNVAAIVDIRRNSLAPRGDNWSDPIDPAANDIDMLRPAEWTLGNIGMVYGITLKPQTGEIFLAASDIYAFDFKEFVSVGFPPPSCSGPAGPGGIYRSAFNEDPTMVTAEPIIFTDTVNYPSDAMIIGGNKIPNSGNTRECSVVTREELLARPRTGNGLGNITYDKFSNHLFATNLEDGKIYSINCATNTITDIFDPFDAYDHTVDGPGLVDTLNRIWAIQALACKRPVQLYFARQSSGLGPVDNLTNRPKQIWSIEVDDDGKFIGNDGDEKRVNLSEEFGRQLKYTDIAFNAKCDRMLVAERGDDHKSRVFEYTLGNNGNWIFEKRVHVGINDDDAPAQEDGIIRGTSAAGGVSYGPMELNNIVDNKCDSIIWATMNCGDIVADPGRCDVYGLEGVSINGNDRTTNGATDIFIDFNPEFTADPLNFKSNIGEVEVFNCCCCEDTGRDTLSNAFSRIGGSTNSVVGTAISNVEISIKSNDNSLDAITDHSGHFAFANLVNDDYMIVPSKIEAAHLGLSTLDLVLIQRHILGVNVFDKAYQYVAADVNLSGQVTATDLVEIRRILLGVQPIFKNNNVWNFIPDLPTITNLQTAIEYNAYLRLEELPVDYMHANFIGVKTGDVNNDYELATNRSTESKTIEYRIEIGANGRKYLNFYMNAPEGISGIQLSLNGIASDATIRSGSINITNENSINMEGAFFLTWSSSRDIATSNFQPLFGILLSDVDLYQLEINSDLLRSELYDTEYNTFIIDLQRKADITSQGELEIYPNPSHGEYDLSFNISKEQDYSIQVINQDGRVLYNQSQIGQKGLQNLKINSGNNSLLKSNGVYIVRVLLEDKILTQKLIFIR